MSGYAHSAKRLSVAAAAALTPFAQAQAHSGTGLAGGFAAGFAHPFTGFDHLLAMICVGLWGAFLGRPLVYALPVVFPAVMAGGAVVGMLGIPVCRIDIGIALSVIALGGCIALALRAPVWLASAMTGLFAVFHGYAHGRELPAAADPIGYSAGFVLATGLLHVCGIGIGCLNQRPGGIVVTRCLGAAIAGAGCWFLVVAVAL